MAGPAEISICPGCGSRLPAVEGPVHAYMTSSPACWAAFGEVMAREYQNPDLMPVHRLSVDAWAAQHPGDRSRQAIQSVGMHLARLMVQLDDGLSGEAANTAMLGFAARKAELPELPQPPRYSLTVADVVEAAEPVAHAAAVRRWAESVWADWSDQHTFIRAWAGREGPVA